MHVRDVKMKTSNKKYRTGNKINNNVPVRSIVRLAMGRYEIGNHTNYVRVQIGKELMVSFVGDTIFNHSDKIYFTAHRTLLESF